MQDNLDRDKFIIIRFLKKKIVKRKIEKKTRNGINPLPTLWLMRTESFSKELAIL